MSQVQSTGPRHVSEVITLHSRREKLILESGIEIGFVRAMMDARQPVDGKPVNELGRVQIVADADARGLTAHFERIAGFPHWLRLTVLNSFGGVAFSSVD